MGPSGPHFDPRITSDIRFLLSKNIFINITFVNHAFLVHLQIRIMCYVSTLDACLVRNEMFFIIVINIIL